MGYPNRIPYNWKEKLRIPTWCFNTMEKANCGREMLEDRIQKLHYEICVFHRHYLMWCPTFWHCEIMYHILSYSGRHVTCRSHYGCSWKAYNQSIHTYSYTHTHSLQYPYFTKPRNKCPSQPLRNGPRTEWNTYQRNAEHCQAPRQCSHVWVRQRRWSGYTLLCCCMYIK